MRTIKTTCSESNIYAAAEIHKMQSVLEQLQSQNVGDIPASIASKYAARAKAGYAVDSTNQQLNDMTLRAPRAGTITYRNAEVGAMANANTKVLTITDTSSIYIDCSLAEADVAALQVGMTRFSACRFRFPLIPLPIRMTA